MLSYHKRGSYTRPCGHCLKQSKVHATCSTFNNQRLEISDHVKSQWIGLFLVCNSWLLFPSSFYLCAITRTRPRLPGIDVHPLSGISSLVSLKKVDSPNMRDGSKSVTHTNDWFYDSYQSSGRHTWFSLNHKRKREHTTLRIRRVSPPQYTSLMNTAKNKLSETMVSVAVPAINVAVSANHT